MAPAKTRTLAWSKSPEILRIVISSGVRHCETSPLQPAFFHNGAFRRLEDAILHHLNVFWSARHYDPRFAGIDSDLTHRLGPTEPVLQRVDPLLVQPIRLTPDEFENLVAFVRDGLLERKGQETEPLPAYSGRGPKRFVTDTIRRVSSINNGALGDYMPLVACRCAGKE